MDLKFSKVSAGRVTIVTLSRPEVYNALHIEAHTELHSCVQRIRGDPEQWVAIVTARRQGVLRRQRPEMAGRRRQARLGIQRLPADRTLRLRQADHRRGQRRAMAAVSRPRWPAISSSPPKTPPSRCGTARGTCRAGRRPAAAPRQIGLKRAMA